MVILIANDKKEFEVPDDAAQLSVLVKTMITKDDSSENDSDDESPMRVPLPNVDSDVLEKIIAFCKHHVDNPMPEIEKPLKSSKLSEVVPEWDAKYIDDLPLELLYRLILAANYMDINSLLHLGCAKVGSLMKGKTPEQIKEELHIYNEFTKEEELQLKEEARWCRSSEKDEEELVKDE